MDGERSRTVVVGRFIREWILVATLPVTIPALISAAFFGGPNFADHATAYITGISGYTIAVTYAFLHDFKTERLQRSPFFGSKVLGTVLDVGKTVLVLMPVAMITLASIVELTPTLSSLLQAETVLLWSSMGGVLAVLLAAVAILINRNDWSGLSESR